MPAENGAQNIKGGLEKYKIIFELSPEAIAITDEKGNILDMNGRVYDWLGYRPEEVIGKNITEVPFLERESRVLVKQNFAKRAAGILIPPYELNFLKKNGEIVVGRVMGSRILDGNKKLLGVILMISDITDRKRMEEKIRASEEKYKNIMLSSPDAITLADLNGNIIDCNRVALELHGFSAREELIGKSSLDLIAKKDQERAIENTQRTLKEGFIKNIEYTLIKKNGQDFPAELSASVIQDANGKPVFFMAIVEDISERKRIDRAKNEFVSIASHQLRTPLTTVNWYTEMLLDKKTGKINAKQKEYLKEVYDATQQLIKLSGLLLDVSRIELGTFKISLKPVNIMDAANNAIESLKGEVTEKDLKIKKDYDKVPIIINGDPNVLSIVFQNLISNAVQYTPNGGIVEISIKKEKSDIILKISDTGYGIPKSQQAQIFTKFFRADNVREKETAGSGLGLYIVKSLLGHCRCKIWFESEEGKGTTFFVSIPFNITKI